MKNKFFVYTSNMRNLPKGLLLFIILLLLILIPLILALAAISLAAGLIYFIVRAFLPSSGKKKTFKPHSPGQVISIDENGNVIK